MNRIKLKAKQKLVFLVIAGVCFGLAVFFWFLVPNMKTTKRLHVFFAENRKAVEELLEADANPKLLAQQISTMRDKLDIIEQAFVDPGAEIEFIQFLENTAKNNSIEQQLRLRQDENANMMSFSLNIECNFQSLLAYLIELETSKYYIDISSLKIYSKGVASRSRIREINRDESGDADMTTAKVLNLSVNLDAQVYMKK